MGGRVTGRVLCGSVVVSIFMSFVHHQNVVLYAIPWFHNTISAVAALDVDEASSLARRLDQPQLEAVLELKSAVGRLVEVEDLGCETEFLCGEAHSKLHSTMCQVCT